MVHVNRVCFLRGFVVIIKVTNWKFNLKEKCDLNFALIKRVFGLKSVNLTDKIWILKKFTLRFIKNSKDNSFTYTISIHKAAKLSINAYIIRKFIKLSLILIFHQLQKKKLYREVPSQVHNIRHQRVIIFFYSRHRIKIHSECKKSRKKFYQTIFKFNEWKLIIEK